MENYAFNNCDSIVSISLPKKIDVIGYGVFDNCLSLRKIFVDFSKIFKYINTPNLLPYKSLFEYTENDNILEYNFNCRTVKIDENKELISGETFLYKLKIDCAIQYEIETESTKNIAINIYNSDYTLLESGTPLELNDGSNIVYSYTLLAEGTYYVEIYFESNDDDGSINYEVSPYTSTDDYISTDDEVDVLTHLHQNKN